MGGGEGRGFSIIKILWSIELNYLWSKKICRPKVIVWSGAAFIHSWSCIFNLVVWLGWFCAQLQVFYRFFISDHSTFYGSTKLNLKNQKPPRFLKCHIYCVLAKGVSFLTDEIQGKSNTDSRYNKIRKDILMAILHVSRSDLLIYSQQKKTRPQFSRYHFRIESALKQVWSNLEVISWKLWPWVLFLANRSRFTDLFSSQFYQEWLTKGSFGTHSSVWTCILITNFRVDHLSHNNPYRNDHHTNPSRGICKKFFWVGKIYWGGRDGGTRLAERFCDPPL